MIWKRIKMLWWLSAQDFSEPESPIFNRIFKKEAQIIETKELLDQIDLE